MIPKSVNIAMALAAIALILVLIHQYQVGNPVMLVPLGLLATEIFAAVWVIFRAKRFMMDKILAPAQSKIEELHLRNQAEYAALSPEQQERRDETDSVNRKAGVTLAMLGASVITFMINPIGGALVSWRAFKWAKNEWRDTDEQRQENSRRRSEANVS